MKLSTFVLIVALLAFMFGLGFLVIPNVAIIPYGSTLDLVGSFMARYFGAVLVGVGVIFFTSRNAKTFEALQKCGILGGLVLGVAGLIVSIWDAIAGAHSAFIWVNVVIYAVLTLGFGYYYFKK